MFAFVQREGGLELNSAYAYIMLCERFRDYCVIAERDDALLGFILGLVSPRAPDTLFIWQIGVAREARGQGLGARMLDALITEQRPRFVEAHVAVGNGPSERLFRGLARRHGVSLDLGAGLIAAWFPEAHADEQLFRIGPFSIAS